LRLPSSVISSKAREQEIADQHGRRIAEHDVGGRLAAPQLAAIDHVVMQQGGGVDEFDRRGELVVARALVADQFRPGERQHRPHALAAAADQVPGQRRDQRDLALHPVEDHGVDRIHRRCRQRQHRIRAVGCLARQGNDVGAHAPEAPRASPPSWQAQNCC
jgi:hypothetical protein